MITEKNSVSTIATYQGKLEKSIAQMTSQEREVHYKKMAIRTREYLFSIGQPFVYKKNGQIIAEYSDGKSTIVQ
jgi:hypothetical protein